MFDFFLNSYKNASTTQILLEAIAFIFGILSVWFAKKENILVYPTGIISTIITSYLLFVTGYLGDMMVNAYFTIMSVYGWFCWSKAINTEVLKISNITTKERNIGIGMFLFTIIVVFGIYKFFDYDIKTDNYLDMIASGIFFTAMWFMAKKKLQNWTLWIIGNIFVIPLYAYRGYSMLALQYIIFTILAVSAFYEWKKTLDNSRQTL